jgi:hypothetical protein
MTSESDKNRDPVNLIGANILNDDPENSSSYVDEIDRKYSDDFRNLLNDYRSTIATDISEIAEGLQLSRPVVGDFMNGKRHELPLSIGRIMHLHKTLSETDRLQTKRPKNRTANKLEKDSSNIQAQDEQNQADRQSITKAREEAKKNRDNLKKEGSDKLLMTAGFQTQQRKMIPVSQQQYSQLSLISLVYKNGAIGQDLFTQIIQQEIEHIEMRAAKEDLKNDKDKEYTENKQKSPSNLVLNYHEKASDYLLSEIKNINWMAKETKDKIETNYIKAKDATDKQSIEFNSHENLGLLSSILHNQLQEDEKIKFGLRVVQIETIPLASFIPTKIKDGWSQCVNEFLKKIDKIGVEKCEYDLRNPPREGSDNKSKRPIHPVTRTIITCRDGDNLIKFEYISAGTHLSTAICAISLNMGLNQAIQSMQIDVRCLGKDIQSLVKASVTLGEDNDVVLGEWVESDLIKSLLQAMIVAGRKWLHKKIPNTKLNYYKKVVEDMARIRSLFYEQRIIYDGYDFNDNQPSIDEFTSINDQSKKCIEYIINIPNKSSEEEKVWNTFLSSFNRIRILSQIYILHHRNIQVSHSQCKSLLREIHSDYNKIKKDLDSPKEDIKSKLLRSSKISFEAEKIAYNLSFGVPWLEDNSNPFQEKSPNLLTVDNLMESLQKLDKTIDDYNYLLKESSMENSTTDENTDSTISKYAVYDIHYSLGSYHSIVGRVLFYKAKNKEEIEESCNRFLRAVYFFEKIGLTRKVERNLTLAGRASVRSGEKQNAAACKEMSNFILREHTDKTNAKIAENFKLSMESRLNSLKGEDSRLQGRHEDGLKSCLKSLKGALWLGLNRHIADNLYIISRCAEEMGNTEYEITDFKELNSSIDLNDDIYGKFISDPKNNPIAKKVILMLFNIKNNKNNPLKWREVAQNFRTESANIWTTWYREATGDEEGEHPFATEIRAEESKFLQLI